MLFGAITVKKQQAAATHKDFIYCYFKSKHLICSLLKKNDT